MNRPTFVAAIIIAIARVSLLVADDAGAIHAISYSHQDLGYANYPHVLRTENRLENLFRAIRYCDQTASWPRESQYRFQQEGSEPLLCFLSNCTREQQEKLAGYMREGRIAVAATHTTVLADRLNTESAARLFYVANRHLPDLLGTPPSRAGMIDDVIGIPWALPIYFEAAQVPYLFHGHNYCGQCDELASAPIVRWTGPAGTGSVLVFSSVYDFGKIDPRKGLAGPAAAASKHITPNYIPVWLQGWDFAITDLEMATAAKGWNDKNAKPTVRISTFETYLDDLSKRQTEARTPTVSKTGPCQWMDQPVSDAWLFGRARQAAERLPVAEKFSAFALATCGGAYRWFDLTVGWHSLLSNFEHTCGAACWRCKNAEGWRHYETEQVEHREEGLRAASVADRVIDDSLDRLASSIDSPHPNPVVIFNSLARSRTDVVTFLCPSLAGKNLSAVDDATGAVTACQWLDQNTLAMIAADVPPLGYRSFHLVARSEAAATAAESKFYRIAIDPATGAVTSLVDKELGCELVKTGAPHLFNQYLYQWFAAGKGPASWSKPPTGVSIAAENGPVAAVYRIRAKAEGVAWLEQTIAVYHAIKRIDFSMRIEKEPSGRSLADYCANNQRGKESVFVALPLNITNFKAVYQTGGGGVAEPVRDQFHGTSTAFYAIQHFADLSNDRFGVTVSPIDFALVEFDHPRSDALSRSRPNGEAYFEKKMEPPKNSSLYLYLLDNMFTTNVRVDQRGEHTFRWALRSHAGDWKAGGAAQFGEQVNQPLIARMTGSTKTAGLAKLPTGARSFASVDAPNVSVSTCKLAEWNGDGFILRLTETEGRNTRVRVNVPFLGSIKSAVETSLTETDLDRPLEFDDQCVRLDVPPYGVKTIRVRGASTACAQVEKLTARGESDMTVALAWEPVAGAAFYRVYRGDAPDFKPSPLTLIAMPTTAQWIDRAQDHFTGWLVNRLNPETTYYYRVEAVNCFNQRSDASASVMAMTLPTARAACPPNPVADLHAILVSPVAPLNQVNLLWRSNVEPNIAGYEVHRSTAQGFAPSATTLLCKVQVRSSSKATECRAFDHQMFLDNKPLPATTYYYRVRAVTNAGLPGQFSDEASVTTKKDPVP